MLNAQLLWHDSFFIIIFTHFFTSQVATTAAATTAGTVATNLLYQWKCPPAAAPTAEIPPAFQKFF